MMQTQVVSEHSGSPPDLLLLAATEGEARQVEAAMVEADSFLHRGKRCITGTLAGRPCRLLFTGVGEVNAAHALTWALEARIPALVLQFGIAGAYVPASLPVGAVALATEEIYGDLGVLTPDGWLDMEEIGFPLVPGDPPRFNRFPLDEAFVRWAAEICGARTGPFVTVNRCSGTRTAGDALFARYGALCESMEGAAAAHVCALYNVPFLEVRGVSNLVEDRDRAKWRIAEAAQAAQVAALKLVNRIADLLLYPSGGF